MLIPGDASRTAPGTWAWPAGLVVWGPGDFAAVHAHHAAQLVLAFEGQLRVRQSRRGRPRRAGAVIVAPDAPHEIDPPRETVLIAFVDPESALAASLLSKASRPVTLVAPAVVRRWRNALGAPHAVTESRVRDWMMEEFGQGGGRAAMDSRVATAVRLLRSRRGELGNASLARLSAVAQLSPSRFAHLFAADVGVPLRRYVLWLRLQRAIAALASGDRVTDAAYAAGFSDAAHLSRTFRRMLGCPPRELVARQKHVRELHLHEGSGA